jgi:hypothetical protein
MTNYDPVTGQFKAVPKDQKTPDMLKMEIELGVNFEDDYMETYINNPDRSQRKFAQRWGASRRTIWSGNKANKSRSQTPSWVDRCKLPYYNEKAEKITSKKIKVTCCEICGEDKATIDNAHWIPRVAGNGHDKHFNIIKLCKNCHSKLDYIKNPIIIEKCRVVLFSRVMKKLSSSENDTYEDKLRLISIAKQIINRKNQD